MGVHGLWKLIDAAGKPVPVETLENKVLAVDVSIWLHQLVKGLQDTAGGSGANAHLLGFFYRICKLLFFRIKPIFIFDGGVPALKRSTIAARQSNRSKANESIEKVRQELLQNLLKQHALGKILGQNVKIPKSVTSKTDSMFFLPPLPSSSSETEPVVASSVWGESEEESPIEDEDSTSSFEEHSPRKKYGDIHSIDVKSKEFKALPADIRHDILSELKETRKQNSWAKVHLMPEDVGDFSSFQMDRLLKRRSVQVGLEEAEKEMGPRCFTVSEIQEILEYQGVDVSKQSQRIASDSTTRFLYTTQKTEPSKGKDGKMERIAESVEELDSDIDDPLIDSLRANEDMSQEEILRLIKEEETKKKARDLVDCGKTNKNSNELILDEIRVEQPSNLDPGKNQIEPTICKKQVTFDNKQVTKLLKDSTKKILPISKIDKVLESRKKKTLKRKVIRKVSARGPNLSESSSDSDTPEKRKQISSESSDDDLTSSTLLKNPSQSQYDSKNNSTKSSIVVVPPSSLSSGRHFIDESRECLIKSINPSKKSDSSDNDFEEVQLENKTDSSSNSDLIDIVTPKNTTLVGSNTTDKNEKNITACKSISLDLNFDKPASDEEDIFADIFEKSNEKRKISSSSSSVESVKNKIMSKPKSISIQLNLEKPPSDEEDIFADVFETPNSTILNTSSKHIAVSVLSDDRNSDENQSKSPQLNLNKSNLGNEYIMDDVSDDSQNHVKESKNLDSIVSEKESERAVILEELLLTKKKLEGEANSSDIDEPIKYDRRFSSDDDLEEVEEEKFSETQESLEEKKYFSDEKLVLDADSKTEEKSPNTFAKKLATVEQVRQFQSTLERESSALLRDKRRDEKIAATVSEQITVDAQELLRLFGIPYLVAPMEAEAQCAFLDLHGLTQGTITDDSDIWLFGANNVYKNFFDQKKFVKLFKSSDIKKVYNLGRNELIMLGLLVGSDYTTGLNGVGPVTALEIVAEFPENNEDLFPPRDRLARFASAFEEHNLTKKLTKKLLPVQLLEGFPSLDVVKAYTDPQVDNSTEPFSWGNPDTESIREFAMKNFGWDAKKTDKTLEPIIDKLKQKKTQMTLHGFFDWAFENSEGKMSRRVEAAVNLLGTSPSKRQEEEEEDMELSQENPRQKAKRVLIEEKVSRKRKPKTTLSESGGEVTSSSEPGPSTSAQLEIDEDGYEATTSTSVSSDFSLAGPSSFVPFIPEPEVPSEAKKKIEPQFVATLPRVNATIEKLRKGKSLSAKPRTRVAREGVSLFKPMSELNFDAPFGSGETRKRKKVQRTDEEKWQEIEEARAKAARVIAKLKNLDQFHTTNK